MANGLRHIMLLMLLGGRIGVIVIAFICFTLLSWRRFDTGASRLGACIRRFFGQVEVWAVIALLAHASLVEGAGHLVARLARGLVGERAEFV